MITNNDIEVKTRHKKLLEQIREGHADERDGGLDGGGHEEVSNPERRDRRAERQNRGNSREARSNPERADRTQGARRGPDSGDGQTHAESIYTTQSDGSIDRASTGSIEISPSARELDEQESASARDVREKELHRQAQKRYEERKKNKLQEELSTKSITSPQTPNNPPDVSSKKSDKPPEKPLTDDEEKTDREKLIYLLIQGTSIADDILEIIVKDHEPVQICELSVEEAGMLVDPLLERAKKSPRDAKAVRRFAKIHDRLHLFLIFGPRIKGVADHVIRHGGVSFR